METRANHLIVGAFVLAAIAGAFGFVLWLGKAEIDREVERYAIYFEDSVTGLNTSSTVRYRGVPVGTVADIRIDSDNSARVRVTIEVDAGTPVKTDSVASLELQGVTGLVNVELSGGSPDASALEPPPGEALAVIPSRPSQLKALVDQLPEALARFTTLTGRAARLLDDENRAAIGATLANVERISARLAAGSGEIDALTGDLASTAADVRRTAAALEGLITELETRLPALADDTASTLAAAEGTFATLDQETQGLGAEARSTLRAVRETAATLDGAAGELGGMIAENRQPVHDFSGEGLYELTRLVVEARELVAAMTRVMNRFESDPARFLFGESEGFEPP